MSPNQYSFCTRDSYINQLLSITFDIFHCFDKRMETRAIILDICQVFDKVWYKDLIYKLCQYGFYSYGSYSFNQFPWQQKTKSSFKWPTFLVGRHSGASISAYEECVPQWSILGPLIVLLWINDISPKLVVDDTSLFLTVTNAGLSNCHIGLIIEQWV